MGIIQANANSVFPFHVGDAGSGRFDESVVPLRNTCSTSSRSAHPWNGSRDNLGLAFAETI
jgi:hypothetical protein